jgi:cytochrome d ubiquinol oxidase subunit II
VTLHDFWFLLLGVLLAGYAVLDGFDLGVGVLHLFARGDDERRIMLNSIGPIWDGNEVWLVTFGGALFAAFPRAYATLLSGLYLPVMLLLFALIGRAISIEFRSKSAHAVWRAYWDASFFVSSLTALFIMGLLVGNAIYGIPLDAGGEFSGTLQDVFSPYAVSVGVFAVIAAALHGALYLQLKVEGALAARVHAWAWTAFGLFVVGYSCVTVLTLVQAPHALANFAEVPTAWLVVLLNVLAVANVPRALYRRAPRYGFFSSCAVILALVFLLGMALYPNLLAARGEGHSLTIFNAASSLRTLGLMRIIAFIGMPFVAGYTALVYWVFRGATKIDKHSY